MVVDWLRSCYKSQFRLWPGAPGVLVQGRYVFAPAGTPPLKAWHNFGSRNWTTDERIEPDYLGEVRGVKQQWANGIPPQPFPLPRIVGSVDCLENRLPLPVLSDNHTPPCATGAKIGFTEGGPLEDRTLDLVRFLDKWALSALGDDSNVYTIAIRWNDSFDPNDCTAFVTCEGATQGPFVPTGAASCNPLTVPFFIPPNFNPPWNGAEFDFIVIEGNPTAPIVENGNEFQSGFDARCFGNAAPPAKRPEPRVDISDLATQTFFAEVLALQYTDSPAAAVMVQDFLGGGAVTTNIANGVSTIPGSIISYTDTQTLMFVSGTSNYQQWAAQFLYGGFGLSNFGHYSTSPLWYAARSAMLGRLLATASPVTMPIYLIGHSYGGAVAALLAAEFHRWQPERKVNCWTMGSPKAGDRRLVALLSDVRRIHVADVGDIVTALPPNLIDVLGLPLVVPAFLETQWLTSKPLGSQWLLGGDGTLVPSDVPAASWFDVIQACATIIPDNPLPPYVAHNSPTYAARFRLALARQQGL